MSSVKLDHFLGSVFVILTSRVQKDSLRLCSPARWRRLCGALRVNQRVRLLDLRDNRLGAYGAEHGELLGNMLKARARVRNVHAPGCGFQLR